MNWILVFGTFVFFAILGEARKKYRAVLQLIVRPSNPEPTWGWGMYIPQAPQGINHFINCQSEGLVNVQLLIIKNLTKTVVNSSKSNVIFTTKYPKAIRDSHSLFRIPSTSLSVLELRCLLHPTIYSRSLLFFPSFYALSDSPCNGMVSFKDTQCLYLYI